MNAPGKKIHCGKSPRKRRGGPSPASLIGNGSLTLAIIWAAALIPNLEHFRLSLIWLPLVVSLFLFAAGAVFIRSSNGR